MNVRILTVEDAVMYRELRLEALATNPTAFVTTHDDYASRPIEQVASRLEPDSDHFTLGAFLAADRLVGTLTFVRERAGKLRHIGNVYAMYVTPGARRQGVGQKLLTDLILRTKTVSGLEQIRLSVVEDNVPAVSLYRSVGFQTYGVEPNVMKTSDRSLSEIHMVLPLSDQVGLKELRFAGKSEGFSHVTVNVSNLEASLQFYTDLGLRLVHRGQKDAYLDWGTAWVCLQERPALPAQQQQLGVDHVALYTPPESFHAMVNTLHSAKVPIVRGPLERGGGWTVNFLDPDGTQLEFHTGTLQERMKVWK